MGNSDIIMLSLVVVKSSYAKIQYRKQFRVCAPCYAGVHCTPHLQSCCMVNTTNTVICKPNPNSFYSYINERRIVRDNIRPLKTLDGIIMTTDNDMANTMNNYFSSVFTIEQW